MLGSVKVMGSLGSVKIARAEKRMIEKKSERRLNSELSGTRNRRRQTLIYTDFFIQISLELKIQYGQCEAYQYVTNTKKTRLGVTKLQIPFLGVAQAGRS
jgi:hypothetical protein